MPGRPNSWGSPIGSGSSTSPKSLCSVQVSTSSCAMRIAPSVMYRWPELAQRMQIGQIAGTKSAQGQTRVMSLAPSIAMPSSLRTTLDAPSQSDQVTSPDLQCVTGVVTTVASTESPF